jgi:hypothetical protein
MHQTSISGENLRIKCPACGYYNYYRYREITSEGLICGGESSVESEGCGGELRLIINLVCASDDD